MNHSAILKDGNLLPVALRGWTQQTVDSRDADFAFRAQAGFGAAVPERHDNLAICSPIEDQGNLGSCTAQAIVGLVEANENRRRSSNQPTPASIAANSPPTVTVSNVTQEPGGKLSFSVTVTPSAPASAQSLPTDPFVHGSRLFQYYCTRSLMNTINADSGASIRTSIKAAATFGFADETIWPYNISAFRSRPPELVWDNASQRKITSYHAIADGDLFSMKAALSQGYLVAFGFLAYPEILSAAVSQSGMLPMPRPLSRTIGGHAVCLVGYDDTMVMAGGSRGGFLVRNSWGTNWGLDGYFWMPYEYVRNPKLSMDFWVVQSAPL